MRSARTGLVAIATAAAASLIGVGASPAAAASDCDEPPVTMRLTGGESLDDEDVRLTDGLARRVPILTGRDEPARTPKQIERLQERAAKSKLAFYEVFLADFRIPRRQVNGEFSGPFPTVEPKAGKTFVSIAVVPTKARGLKSGDVLRSDDELAYDTTTTFAPIGLRVVTGDGQTQGGSPGGRVEVLSVDDDSICLDVDFRLSDGDTVVAAAEGVVSVPVVQAPRRVYFF